MASPVSEVDRFVSGLRNRTLHVVVDKLNIGFHSRISYRNLSSDHTSSSSTKTYKLEEKSSSGDVLDQWVVKFNPTGKKDPWNDVKKEYHILDRLYTNGKIPVPQPLHCSTQSECRIVGTDFLVMEYVKGKHFNSVQDIPVASRRVALESVMKVLGMLHKLKWKDKDYVGTAHFWHCQAETWDRNYKETGPLDDSAYEHDLFVNLRSKPKPYAGESSAIHGDINISNVIFDDEYRIKAFIDWKYDRPGDPMLDVASFCMIFLQPRRQVHGYYAFRELADLELLAGPPNEYTPSEEEMIEVYKDVFTRKGAVFHEDVFHYAKAIKCMRWISILKVAMLDGLENHKIGKYLDKRLVEKAIECLSLVGDSSYDQYCQTTDSD